MKRPIDWIRRALRNTQRARKKETMRYAYLRMASLFVAAVSIAGCASRAWNDLKVPASPMIVTPANGPLAQRPPKDTFIVLAFSGGGTRSAAFAYGVLEGLRDTEVTLHGGRQRILDEVDVISAVSGGSYTAAYYGLFRDRLFTDFERVFLKRDIEGELIALLFNPVTASALVSPQFNRSDLAAEWLGEKIFEKKTFSDLNAKGRPFVVINASDINTGMTFSFVQQQFDFLCSSIGDYPVANAVMASSAVPGVFAPIAVRNYDVDCPERRDSWVRDALRTGNVFSRDYQVALALDRYSNPPQMPIVRLVDGGVTDNLGVRGSMMSPVLHFGNVADMAGAFDQNRLDNIARVLVIVANAQTYGEYDWSKQGLEPGLIDNVQASFETSIGVINSETISLAMRGFRQWADHVSVRPSRKGKPPVDLQFAVLTFDKIRDAAERRAFNDVPTSFSLKAEQVDFVRSVGKRLLLESSEFKTFVARSH